jgi:hypothetical protein
VAHGEQIAEQTLRPVRLGNDARRLDEREQFDVECAPQALER